MNKARIAAALKRALRSGRPRKPLPLIRELKQFNSYEVRSVIWDMFAMQELVFTWNRKVQLPKGKP